MKLSILILILVLVFNVNAAQSLSTKINSPYSSIRALGMGDAFTAVADDYSLIMYNPAGFSRKKHNEIQMTLLGAGVASKTLTIADDIKKASDTVGTDAEKAQAVSNVLDKYYGQTLGGKIQAMEIFWVRNGWGIALLPFDLTVDMSINKQLGPAIDLNVKGDTTAAFGFGMEIAKNIDAGLTAKYTHRVSVEEIVPAFELATDPNVLSDKRFKEGTKADFDLGFMWRPNWFNNSSSASESIKTEAVNKETKVAPVDTSEEEPKLGSRAEAKKDEIAKPEEKKIEDIPADLKRAEEERKPQSEIATDSDKKSETDITKNIQTTEPTGLPADVVKSTDSKLPTAGQKEEIQLKPVDSKAKELKAAEPKSVESKPIETAVAPVESKDEKFPLTFGFVVHNVVGGDFTLSKQVNKNATEVPTKLYRVIDIGSQYLLRDGEDFKIRYMLDFKNILHPEISLTKSFHTGIEFDYSPNTWFKTQFRAGLNQMYYTAGASFLFAIINIDVVTYGEEVGTETTKLENRVLAAKVGFSF